MIYFAQPVGGGPVKIGYSEDVNSRIQQLEIYYKQPLVLLRVIPGDRSIERSIHERFAHLRFGRTEQFRPESDLMEFIGCPLMGSPTPETVEAMDPPKPMALQMRGDPAWKAWVEEFAESERSSVANTTDRAIARYAREVGFPKLPPKR